MSTIQLLIVCVTVITLALVVPRRSGEPASTRTPPPPPPPPPKRDATTVRRAVPALTVGSSLVVHTRDERSIRGTLAEFDDATLVLSNVALVMGGEQHDVGGTIRVPRSNESWLQILGTAPPPRAPRDPTNPE